MGSLIVTPAQYKEGYSTFLGGPKPYLLIRKLEDGNYLVVEPGLSFPRGMGKTHANKKAKEYIQDFLDNKTGGTSSSE